MNEEMEAEISVEQAMTEEISDMVEPTEEEWTAQTAECLADGFLQLCEEVPDLKTIEDVPETVLQMAVDEKIPLLDAYLRYRWREECAVLAEQQRQQRTGEQSAGSLYTGDGGIAPASDAFSRAFKQALR
jgi:hypothetical protein